MDQFTDPTAQNPSAFLTLQNVLPSLKGGFDRRWGLTLQEAVSRTTNYVRMFNYAAAKDTTFTGTVDMRLLLGTDGINMDVLYNEVGTPAFGFNPFSFSANIWGVTSRNWFYVAAPTGSTVFVNTPKKIDYSQNASSTLSNWGITNRFGATTINGIMYADIGPSSSIPFVAVSGSAYTSAPTVTISGGGGSGATANAFVNGGGVSSVDLTAQGSGYTSVPTVTLSGGGGSGATFTAIVGTDSTRPGSYQRVIAIVMTGPMQLVAGRTYAYALKNSVTGHTSDYLYSFTPSKGITTAVFIADPADAQDPGFAMNQGFSALLPTIVIHTNSTSNPLDSQVDTVVLMASSDGGDILHMYEVAQIPLSSFTITGSFPVRNYTFQYTDNVPDTYNDIYLTGITLLTQNLWVDVDSNGNVIGVADNTPPLNTIGQPVVHQGRMFMTDGKSLYFSKSIDEVTTSTGLITSKWEEAWPGSNVLDIAYDDELINGLLSDGQVLYIGTSDNIFRLLGSSASNFSIPEAIFRGVGVQSQDAWTVIYKDNIPAGYTWVTADAKIMISDFNTYQEIGKAIEPLLQTLGPITHIQSLSYGPYSFALYSVQTGANPTYLLYDTKNGGWYIWVRALQTPPTATAPAMPLLSYTLQSGVQKMYTMIANNGGTGQVNALQFFDVHSLVDASINLNSSNGIPWTIETSWINLCDTATSSVLNEIELWTQDPLTHLTVHKAQSAADFISPILVKTGAFTAGPLQTQKFYLAGSPSFGRYHKLILFTDVTTGVTSSSANVLRQFQFEYFPQTRT